MKAQIPVKTVGKAIRKIASGVIATLTIVVALPALSTAQEATIALEPVADGFVRPVYVTADGVNPDRLYVVEQTGTVRIIENGTLAPEPFMDVSKIVRSEGNEQGLLSIAFAPDYATSGEVYAGFTANRGKGAGNNTVARFVVGDDGTVDSTTMKILVSLEDEFPHHNGGLVIFGPDGDLYAGFGDGGSQGDGQGLGSANEDLFGDILRIDVGGSDAKRGYTVPDDN
ncbi:MAG: PQQ-dependent sugar dehydrogenase, partial [Chloroflexota bacterium]